MNLGKLLKRLFNPRPIAGYVSEVDKFLETFDAENSENASATQERKKHEAIAHLRDNVAPQTTNVKIWQEF